MNHSVPDPKLKPGTTTDAPAIAAGGNPPLEEDIFARQKRGPPQAIPVPGLGPSIFDGRTKLPPEKLPETVIQPSIFDGRIQSTPGKPPDTKPELSIFDGLKGGQQSKPPPDESSWARLARWWQSHLRFSRGAAVAGLLTVGLGIGVLASPFRRNYLPALLGRAKSQYIVGAAYKFGASVSQNYTKAGNWFKSAADAGFSPAQYEYGVLRYYGFGCNEDQDEGLRYFEQAAKAGIPEAQFLLGSLLLTQSDRLSEAENWIRMAAERRYAPAEFALANEYIAGTRFREDYIAADVLLRDLRSRNFEPAEPVRIYLEQTMMTEAERTQAEELWSRNVEHRPR